jgi:polar amino acid transport system substrate-binding protein
VAIAANREPMCFISENEIVGLDCELIERIAYELGRPVNYNDMKFSALIASLESGKTDLVISNMTATEERRKAVNFSDGYFVNPQVLLTLKVETSAVEKPTFLHKTGDSFYNNILHEKRYVLLWRGFQVTFLIAVLAALLGTVLGGVICFFRMSKSTALKLFARVYIDLLRGIPQVVLLMLMFYVVLAPLQFSGVVVAIITFALNFSAYVSEMFRSSIESVGKGQTEAGIAMGFSKVKTFVHIVLPQAVQRVLPVYKGEFIALVKMTAIVGYIAVQDLTKASDIIRSRTFEAFFPLIMVAVIYFLLAWLLTFLIEKIQLQITPKRKS